jgi:hypothetical protein
MPRFEFTLVVERVDFLSDASQQAVDEYNDGFLDDPPLDGVLFTRDGAQQKTVFSVATPSYEDAVAVGIDALRQALPAIEIRSVLPGRHPGDLDIV